MDLVVVPTIGFLLLYGFVIPHPHRRRIITVAVTSHPTAEWIARQVAEAFPWQDTPQYLLRDRDGVHGHVIRQRLAMGIRDRPITVRSPWQNGHVERLIGAIRCECLDHVIVFGDGHLRRILKSYADYNNRVRTHLSLGKDAPIHRPANRTGRIVAIPMLEYVRI
jgi:transposase InsO family protein